MKLISMTDFVLELETNEHWAQDYTKCVKYANFLKQPLTLGMFVPCDEDGNFLPEDLDRDWPDIVARFECQINVGLESYFGNSYELWRRALNYTFGNSRPPRYEVNRGQVKITKAGETWLKDQLKSFAAKNLHDVLYQRGGHRA